MKQVNTKDKLKTAALALFAKRGFANTSIAAIEAKAGLAPRAGAFYRHFKSKQALFETLARETITETPDEFDFDGLKVFADTRAELIALARQFETASERQKPYLRLIEEVRLTPAGRRFEARANETMLNALMQYCPVGRGNCETPEVIGPALRPVCFQPVRHGLAGDAVDFQRPLNPLRVVTMDSCRGFRINRLKLLVHGMSSTGFSLFNQFMSNRTVCPGQFGQAFGQRHHGSQCHRRRAA